MALTSFVQPSFLGGEISQVAQGRMDRPEYKISMNVCLNGIPVETGAVARRPGTQLAGTTRGGGRGRVIAFSFQQNAPYTMEFTDGFLRFWSGTSLATTNDAQTVTAISAANPAAVTTGTHGWTTGNSGFFSGLGSNNALLQNRLFKITVTGATAFTLADAITGATIDGSTLGTFVSGTFNRVLEVATSYTSGTWSTLRSVQAEDRTLLLNGTRPNVLQVATAPNSTNFATFTLSQSSFIDGPYLDPIASTQVTPSAVTGEITLTVTFLSYDATRAYNIGDFVTSAGVSYESLTALNLNHTPASSPSNWKQVNGGAAINNGAGIVSADDGRLVRLFSEPPLWVSGSTHGKGDVVAYSDGNGGYSYWTYIGNSSSTDQPGTTTNWAVNATAAQWTWGQIISISGSGLIPAVSSIGTFVAGGGLDAAFDGNTAKAVANSAAESDNIYSVPIWTAADQEAQGYSVGVQVQYQNNAYQALINIPPDAQTPSVGARWSATGIPLRSPTYRFYVGQHYASGSQIEHVTVFPTTDIATANNLQFVTFNLRASNSAPTSSLDGTLLATVDRAGNEPSPLNMFSNDQTTTWHYVWVEVVAFYQQALPAPGSTHIYPVSIGVAQLQIYAPNVSNGAVFQIQLRGPALLYQQTIRTWRLGVYSDNTGWPTCGCYASGRIWLGGVVPNRFDASVSNGFTGTQINFTPTSPDGTVSDDNAISETFTGSDVNKILWMEPDQQGIICGTQAGEILVFAPGSGSGITPSNIDSRRIMRNGCANIEPRRTEHTLIFVQRYQRKLMEAFPDVYSGKFTAPNLTEWAKHLTVSGIAEIAYQQELVPTIWARRNDGSLVGATYKRDTLTTSQGPTFIAWHRHTLGSGRRVESLCVGPSTDGTLDSLTAVTNDLSNGIRHVEVLGNMLDENFTLTQCNFLDDAIVPSSTVVQLSPTGGPYGSLVVNGLWPLNGKTVSAFIAGLDCGDFTVSNGSITIPFGDGISAGAGSGLLTVALVQSFATVPALIGFTYNSDGQLVRPVTAQDTGAQAGPGFAKNRRLHRYAAQLFGCVNGSIAFGSDFTTLDPAKLQTPDGTDYTVQQLFGSIVRGAINSKYDFDGMIAWRISRPLPAFVTAIGGFGAAQDA